MQINPIRVAGSFALGFSLFVSILGGQFKLVPGLNQINKNENDNYKIKGDDRERLVGKHIFKFKGATAFELINCRGKHRDLSSLELAERRRECKRLFLMRCV